MSLMKSPRKAKIALYAVVAALALIAMGAFFVIGAAETGLTGLLGGNFFAPENLLAWQIPALRGRRNAGGRMARRVLR